MVIVAVGAFPPPVHGAALANAAIVDQLRSKGVDPVVVDLVPIVLGRSLRVRLSRLPKAMFGLGTLVKHTLWRESVVYISLSGGLGQIYDVMFIVLARLTGARLFLHHHSYAYVIKRSALTGILLRAAGERAVQVALCTDMGDRLRRLYPRAGEIRVISNAALVPYPRGPTPSPRGSLQSIGFLGNVSCSKGILQFLETLRRLSASHGESSITGTIAGPFSDSDVEIRVRALLNGLPNVSYIGPVSGTRKSDFLRSLDVLLFPTTYENEAEPLTILEAMSYGVPVIAWGRGCIPSMIAPGSGTVIDTGTDFVQAALGQLQAWMRVPDEYRSVSIATIKAFDSTKAAYSGAIDELCRDMMG